jgi:hypothetical protein
MVEAAVVRMVAVVVIVLVPFGVALAGLTVQQVASLGSPEQISVTALLNPLSGVILTNGDCTRSFRPHQERHLSSQYWLATPKSDGSSCTVTFATEEADWAKEPLAAYAAVID